MTFEDRRILVAAPNRWDEACFAVPAIRALQAAGLELTVACDESQRCFWQTLPELEILTFSRRTRARALASTLGDSWQAALVWDRGLIADAARHARLPHRIGPATPAMRKWLTHPLDLTELPQAHRVRFYLRAIELLEIDASQAAFFAAASIPGPMPDPDAVMFCPDSDFGPSHEWPLDRWIELGRMLLAAGRNVTIAGWETGRGLGSALAVRLDHAAGFFRFAPTGDGAFHQLARHPLVVAADGTLPHLAAHCGATCVTLFGPNDPVWKRPLGRHHRVIHRHVECSPCLRANCPLDLRCQNELSLEQVVAAVLR